MTLNSKAKKSGFVLSVRIEAIRKNPAQPRKSFDEDTLYSLAESIRENGIIQPLCIRRTVDGEFELISGERRLRAARLAGLRRVPCIISEATGTEAALLAVIENLQRENLNCFEEAMGIQRLITDFSLTREEASAKLGLSQSGLSNKLRLLRLTEWQKGRIAAASLSERHARALLRIEDPELANTVLDKIIAENMTVMQTEAFITQTLSPKPKAEKPPEKRSAVGDVRIFTNTINHAVDTMRRSGLSATAEKTETDRFIEYKIMICKCEA